MFKFVPGTEEIAKELLNSLTWQHKEELSLLPYGDNLGETVLKTVEDSDETWACYTSKGVLCGMFGIKKQSLATQNGQPWLLMTEEALKHKRELLVKGARIAVDYWMRRYDLLFNYVPAAYVTGLKWLKMLGFEIIPVTASLYRIEKR